VEANRIRLMDGLARGTADRMEAHVGGLWTAWAYASAVACPAFLVRGG